MQEGVFRYFNEDEIHTIITEKRENQYDIWVNYSKLSDLERDALVKDKTNMKRFTKMINESRTIKLLVNYDMLKQAGELIEYTSDLEDAFYSLIKKNFSDLEYGFENATERNGWIIVQKFLYDLSQEDIEIELAATPYAVSQRRISQILKDYISKLTVLLIDR